MVVVEAARRGKQLNEVHGFAVAASSWIWVRQMNPLAGTTAPGAASRSRGSRARSAQASGHLAVTDLEAEVAGEAAAAGLQVPGLGADPGQQLLVRVPAEHGVLVPVHLGEHRPPDRRRSLPGGVLGEQLGQGERVVAKPEHAAVEPAAGG
jgi:hypothetical protein